MSRHIKIFETLDILIDEFAELTDDNRFDYHVSSALSHLIDRAEDIKREFVQCREMKGYVDGVLHVPQFIETKATQ